MTQTLLPLQKVAEKNAWVGRMKSGFTTFFRVGTKFDVDKLHDVFAEPGQPNAWGALVNALKEEGHIRKTGRYYPSARPEANGRIIWEWEVIL